MKKQEGEQLKITSKYGPLTLAEIRSLDPVEQGMYARFLMGLQRMYGLEGVKKMGKDKIAFRWNRLKNSELSPLPLAKEFGNEKTSSPER